MNRLNLGETASVTLNHMPTRFLLLLWAPLIAASLHVFEEFVGPGGFRRWYRRYRGGARTVSRRVLVLINTGLLATLLEGALAGSTPFGPVLLLTFSAALLGGTSYPPLSAGYHRQGINKPESTA